MSLNSIAQCATDHDLRGRVSAAVNQLVQTDPMFGQTEFGVKLLSGFTMVDGVIWQVAVDVEQEYEYAVLQGRGSPGHDKDVITDERLVESVKAHWPPDAYVAPALMPPPIEQVPNPTS